METQTVSGKWSMAFGVLIDLILNLGLSGVLIWVCTLHYYMFQWWVIKRHPAFAVVTILCGVYMLISFVGTGFIFYAVVSDSSLRRRKNICCRWLIFRITSFLIPIAFLFNFGERTMVYICSATMLFWFISMGTVTNYMSYLSEAIEEEASSNSSGNNRNMYQRPLPGVARRHLHRPSSQVKPMNQLSAGRGKQPVPGLTIEHLKQLEQFQEYIRRTSWCSWGDEGGGFPHSGRGSRTVSAAANRF